MIFASPSTELTKANEIDICIIDLMVPLAYVRQSTMNRIPELLKLQIVGHGLLSLLQEL